MSRIGPRNPILIRLFTIIFALAVCFIVVFYAIKILLNSNSLNYKLGNITQYHDEILINFSDYKKFVENYGITQELVKMDFENNSYLASFQDYDKCSERKVKSVEEVNVKDAISITFKTYNKCGWCKAEKVVYLIKIDKLESKDIDINYSYTYDKELNCGTVSLVK